nr:MAG TPA: hypothetical protein [Caudoviricetes sp.]
MPEMPLPTVYNPPTPTKKADIFQSAFCFSM